ncbi:helix-turn-helix transcriptional regulator [Ruicaihuangia caeni]|uniref:WYL domain-containing protein n=1 Tax=Ruicaihuangia caeni TaxID=3042517 RepID=A0AAW6T789_9MICO|nr:WYL domain-containing protein [Klugiella sp. YN-L-19]MDI2098194.1 WYL domain-containing protein [Klugiella sp. YN-L-19]
MAERIRAEERLFSLVLALLTSEHGLTKNEILSTVQGYRERYEFGGDLTNLERQFERDKDDIRELGVPLETLEPPGEPGNNQNTRYRIPRVGYELPHDIAFTPEESALLKLAAMVWRDGAASAEARRAMLKLSGLGVDTAELALQYAPRLRVRDAAFEPLRSAIEKRRVVRFGYLKPGEDAATQRELAPLALTRFAELWHLYAEEPGTGRRKTFLLSRITTPVTITKTELPARDGDPAAESRAELEKLWAEQSALLEAQPSTDAESRLLRRPGTSRRDDGLLVVHFTDLSVLADQLCSYGPEVVVIAPEELKRAVRSRLDRVGGDHG